MNIRMLKVLKISKIQSKRFICIKCKMNHQSNYLLIQTFIKVLNKKHYYYKISIKTLNILKIYSLKSKNKLLIQNKYQISKETLKIFHYLFQKIRSQPTLILLSYPKKGKNLSLYFRMIDYEQFQRLFDIVSLNENNINRFVIKFMDNDFNQLKCDLLKTSFQKMKNLEQLRIQNYYSECKMGVFDQFNWHPYRRKIEIFSKKW